MNDFYVVKQVTATRKAWTCFWCGEAEQPGSACTVHVGVFEGDFWTERYHPECYEQLKSYWAESGGEHPEPHSMLRGHGVEKTEACDICRKAPFTKWDAAGEVQLCDSCYARLEEEAVA